MAFALGPFSLNLPGQNQGMSLFLIWVWRWGMYLTPNMWQFKWGKTWKIRFWTLIHEVWAGYPFWDKQPLWSESRECILIQAFSCHMLPWRRQKDQLRIARAFTARLRSLGVELGQGFDHNIFGGFLMTGGTFYPTKKNDVAFPTMTSLCICFCQ